MKPYDKVNSLRGANTLLQGQQINGQRRETYRRENIQRIENRRERQKRDHRRSQSRSQERDQTRDQRRRSKENQGPEQRNQDLSETQCQRVRAHGKKSLQ
jgi:hypothetical protein